MTESKTLALGPAATGPEAQEARIVSRYGTAAAASGGDIQRIVDAAKKMQHSGLMPQHIDTPEKAIIIGLRGAEIGLPLIQSWHSMYVIQGRAAMEAKTMVGLAQKHMPTFDITIVKLGRDECIVKARRSKEHSWTEITYDMEDAKAAGLTSKSVWSQHPKAMLLARAQAMVMRAVAPDTFQGLYTKDEIESGAPAIEEGAAEDIVEGDWSESAPAEPAGMTQREIVDAIVEGGLQADAKRARKDLDLAADDNSEDALRAIWDHINAAIDGGK